MAKIEDSRNSEIKHHRIKNSALSIFLILQNSCELN